MFVFRQAVVEEHSADSIRGLIYDPIACSHRHGWMRHV
jgi:hypothetical protein